MKKEIILTIVLMFSGLVMYSQMPDSVINVSVDPETKLIVYQDVKQQKGNKTELFNRANGWFRIYYRNPSGVTKIQNLEKGLITGVARFRCVKYDKKGNKLPSFTIQYSLKINLKDNKYRITLSEFNVRKSSYFPLEKWLTEPKYNTSLYIDALNQIDAEMKKLLNSFHTTMAPEKIEKDDW